MRLPLAVAVVSGLVLASRAAHAGSGYGFLIPPAEVDVGVGMPVGGEAVVGSSTEILAGLQWASLYWKPTPVDLGVGYVGSFRQVLPGYAARGEMPAAGDNTLRLNGVYLDLAKTIQQHDHWRMWLAFRGELLSASVHQQSFSALGAAVRVSTEIYAQTVGATGDHDAFGAIAGTLALGFYVEASHRELAPELGPNAVTAGLSLRVPFLCALVD